MRARTDYQKIEYQGQPAFVLVPWEDFDHVRIRPWLEGKKSMQPASRKRLSKRISSRICPLFGHGANTWG